MRQLVESLKRLYQNKQITQEKIKGMKYLTAEEKKFILEE